MKKLQALAETQKLRDVARAELPRSRLRVAAVVSVDDVREFVLTLPRAYEVFVRGRIKFRVGKIVFVAFSRDETTMGFGFPKEWRRALVEAEPEKFFLPGESDMRFHWVCARMEALDVEEMQDLVLEAWAMCVPKYVSAPFVRTEP